MLVRLLKPVFLIAAVFAAVWLLVFFYWRYTARLPSSADIVIWLLVVPVGLLLAGWGGLVAWRSLSGGAADAAQAAAATPTQGARATAEQNAQKGDAAEARFQLAVLASSLRTPHGADPAELATAVVDGQRPEPDPTLRNDAGFPVFVSRIAELDIDPLREQLAGLPLVQSGEIDVDSLPDERLRTLQSLSEVLSDLLAQAVALAAPAQELAEAQEAAFEPVKKVHPVQPNLRASVLLPAWWTEPERLLADQWLQQLSKQEDPERSWRFDHFGASPEAGAWTLLDRINLALNREATQPALWIVLAGESAISESRVAQWEAQGQLHQSERRPGLTPGEAAAGLLLTAAADPLHAQPEAALLSRPAFGRTEASADTSRVSRESTLGVLADRLLAIADLKLDAVQWTVSDTDHRVSRVTEFARLLQDKLPHVPFDSNNFFLGAACGHMGVAAELVGLALASQLAAEHKQAVLVSSVQDAHARGAVLVTAAAPSLAAA